jgi:hypothetical protein
MPVQLERCFLQTGCVGRSRDGYSVKRSSPCNQSAHASLRPSAPQHFDRLVAAAQPIGLIVMRDGLRRVRQGQRGCSTDAILMAI